MSCRDHTEPPAGHEAVTAKKMITISAVGDVMMPGSIQAAVARKKHDYYMLFEKVAADLSAADITIANLETPVDSARSVSGYPKFNTSPALLTALKRAGVDVVSIANNHIMDQGVAGLRRTMDNISAAGLVFIGAGRTRAEADEPKFITAGGITCAFLAYTYGSNERLPGRKANSPGVAVLRTNSDADLARSVLKVSEARQAADLVVVSIHWGDEYSVQPTPWQRRVAEELVRAGADIIIGHHPHVLRPIETIAAGNRRGIAAYSLGNFISSQNHGVSYSNKDHPRALRGDGVILNITAAKTEAWVSIERVEFVPTWTLREKIGGVYIQRPVSLGREIARLQAMPSISKEEERMLIFLRYRTKVITEMLTKGRSANSP